MTRTLSRCMAASTIDIKSHPYKPIATMKFTILVLPCIFLFIFSLLFFVFFTGIECELCNPNGYS